MYVSLPCVRVASIGSGQAPCNLTMSLALTQCVRGNPLLLLIPDAMLRIGHEPCVLMARVLVLVLVLVC